MVAPFVIGGFKMPKDVGFVSDLNSGFYKINCNTPLSKLYITKNVVYHFTYKKPNLWWRFWQYTLLGWKWENYK